MVKSNLFDILRALRRSELKRFEELIISPYFNKNSNVIKLFKYVKKFYPEFKNEKLKKEMVWNGIFKGRKFNYGIMKNLIHELNKLTEKFLELQEYEKNEFQSGLNLLNQLRHRNLNSRFEKLLKTNKVKFVGSEINIDYYYYIHHLEQIEQNYYYEFYKNKNEHYGNSENLNRYLSSYFFTAFFYQNCDVLMSKNFFKSEHSTKDLEALLRFFDNNVLDKEMLTMLFYYAIKLILNPEDETLYYEAKRIFLENIDKMDRLTRYNIGAVLSSYWSLQRMKGNMKLDADQFEIFKLMLENNLYPKEGSEYFEPYIFSSIIGLATALGHITWCQQFIDEYHDKLNPVDRNNHYYFGMFALNRAQNKLDLSLKCLSRVNPKNVMEKITVKREEIKIYYELKYFDEIYSLIKSCKEYIKHDKYTSVSSKSGFNDLLNFTKKLVDINFNPDSGKYDEHYFKHFKNQILEKQFISKTWVLNRLQALEESAKCYGNLQIKK